MILVIETDPHITVHMGLKDNLDLVKGICKNFSPFMLRIQGFGMFDNKRLIDGKEHEWDVLWRDVHDDQASLLALHKTFVDAFNKKWHHPVYNSHITIAYLKYGRAQKYASMEDMAPVNLKVDHIIYKKFKGGKDETYTVYLG
jgi:2'-5' RNA ligase